MLIREKSLDDVLIKLYNKLIKSKNIIKSSKGINREILGVYIELTDPRARLSRSEAREVIFSSMGEFLWYMTKDNSLEFIEYFIPKYRKSADGKIINGGYGKRIFDKNGFDQFNFVIEQLRRKPSSRQAVIQIFDASDSMGNSLGPYKDIPCTCTIQFFIRNNMLHMMVHMRSNDAFIGLPHDIFCFTMLQELLSQILSVKLGIYRHSVASMHLYEEHFEKANLFIKEGLQDYRPMPPLIKDSDQIEQIEMLLGIERKIRNGIAVSMDINNLDTFWSDWARILLIKKLVSKKDLMTLRAVKQQMQSKVYETYIKRKDTILNNNITSQSNPYLPGLDKQ